MAPSILLFFLLLSFLLVMLITKVESQNTTFNIVAFTPHTLLLTYERGAFVPPDTTYVRLVRGPNPTISDSNVGRVLFSAPVRLWEQNTQASFETTITFQITPSFTRADHGLTFFMVPVNSTTNGGGFDINLGIYNAVIPGSAIFAVEFDIVSESHDPPYPHIGININSIRSQNTTRFENATRTLVTARITYDVPTRMISVVATYGSSTATVSFAFNLKALLPQLVQVGLSASTGSGIFSSNYDVFTWHFNSTVVPDVNSVVVDDNTYIKQYVM